MATAKTIVRKKMWDLKKDPVPELRSPIDLRVPKELQDTESADVKQGKYHYLTIQGKNPNPGTEEKSSKEDDDEDEGPKDEDEHEEDSDD